MTSRSFVSLFFVLFGLTAALASAGKLPPLYVAHPIVVETAEGPVTLRAGTPIVVESIQTYPAKNLSMGQTVSVRAKFNVVVDKKAVISAGALGSATISNIEKPKIWGKGGRMELQVQSVQAVDGQQVLLSGIPLTCEGDDKRGLAIGLAIGLGIGLGLLVHPVLLLGGLAGFLIKGKPAELKAGTTLNSSVASEIDVDVPNK